MKQSFLLSFLVLMTVALLATSPTYSWHVQPTMLSFSMYDYMNGAYDGYPIRIQEDNIQNQGIYMTYMANQTLAVPRRQNYAFSSLDGTVQAEGTITSVSNTEGFGTLAIDPESGNPFFVWHAGYGDTTFNSYFTWDIFSFSNVAGNAFADHAPAITNNPNETNHEYIWPVIHIGPSPIAGKRRVYVFAANSRSNGAGNPSSSITLAYADFDTDDIEMGLPEDFNIYWVTQRIPYFLAIHDWIPGDGSNARAFPSYAISQDGKVALAGQLQGYNPEWSGMPEHDTFVVLSENYGETFTATGLNLNRHLTNQVPVAYHQGQVIVAQEFRDKNNVIMSHATLNHKTMAFDSSGKLHFPNPFMVGHVDSYDGTNYIFPIMQSVNTVIYDPDTQTKQVYQMLPRSDNPLNDEVQLLWDLDNDGWIDNFDLAQDETGGLYAANWCPKQFSAFHHSWDNYFHYNQMRMTQFNEYGDAAMMWMDGTNAYLYNEQNNEDYWEYAQVPEIMITLTNNSGQDWTEPIRLNVLNHPELGDIPSYVYPADKIIRLDSETVRLYFMYVDDKSYGSINQSLGANIGAEIKFASLDIVLDNTFTPNYFNPVWSGNGYQHMNFYALEASVFGEDLEIGDEIGIFDGEYCVGAIKIRYEHLYASYIPIITSQNDPYTTEIDGFTPGNSVTFKIWKRAQQTEYTAPLLNIEYVAGSAVFAPNASATVKINTGDLIIQQIPMISGWNIMSAGAESIDSDMLDIFAQFIDNGSLSKIQNQSGLAVEMIGEEWINYIGDLDITQGYRVRLNNNATLSILGDKAELPMEINLSEGWNLISFPYQYPEWSEYLLEELIDSGNLLKVIDEQGNAIEELNYIGWINHIGFFMPGKGYAVRVNEDCTLTYGDSRSGIDFDMSTIVRTNTKTQHFERVWQGNGWQHFNIYLTINEEFLQNISIGDEIAVYDNDICVGVAVYNGEEDYITITSSMSDNSSSEQNGFRPNENFSLRFYKSNTQTETIDSYIDILEGDNIFTANGSAVVSLSQFTSNTDTVIPNTTGINAIYPNPFNPDTNIRFSLKQAGEIKLEIFNVKGQRIKTLVEGHHNAGIYQVNWNGLDNNNKKVSSGIYFTRLVTSEKQQVKKMVLIK